MSLFRRTKINKPKKANNSYVETTEYSIWQLVNEIRNLASTINFVYAEYDIMEQDTIIGAALNLYADNAVQIDDETGRILQVVSDDKNLARELTNVLDKLEVEDKLWNTAYNTGKYGNKYWRIITNQAGNDIVSIEEIDDPSSVMDLYIGGKPSVFAYNEEDRELTKTEDYNLYDRNSFVHFMIQSGKISDRILLSDMNNINEETGEPEKILYRVIRGESMIEGIRVIYRILKALEDSLLAARIAKSQYDKIINIEVGDSNEIETRQIVNTVKRLFDSRFAMNVTEGSKSAQTYNQPRPFMDPVFNSVNNGIGAISVETSGGEFEVKDIADLDYFNKIKFSGLHITPSMLAFEENIPGGMSGSAETMIQQDIRFAMYVKKLVKAITDGVEDLLKIWLKLHKRDHDIGKFTVRMLTPSVTEDIANLNALLSRLESINNLSEIINNNSPGINSAKLTKLLLEEYIPNKTFLDKLMPLIDESAEISDIETKITKEELDGTLENIKNNKDKVIADVTIGEDGLTLNDLSEPEDSEIENRTYIDNEID